MDKHAPLAVVPSYSVHAEPRGDLEVGGGYAEGGLNPSHVLMWLE